jgi:hypothetical protein
MKYAHKLALLLVGFGRAFEALLGACPADGGRLCLVRRTIRVP